MSQRPDGRPVKYVFVTGGVVSSLGKGLAAASIGRLLEDHGYKVALQKFDPYINVDPGTMSPYQHGEVYVTDDGAETDLDLGHYERFTSMVATRNSNWTTGKIYLSVIQKERRGDRRRPSPRWDCLLPPDRRSPGGALTSGRWCHQQMARPPPRSSRVR